jgi:dinuclear metal center YbgI/SA1388 family protein
VREAVDWNADLIVAHHPLIFNKLEAITPTDDHGRMIYELIQNDIGVVAAHTNLDAAPGGVSMVLADTLGLQDITFLDTSYQNRYKIIFDTSLSNREAVRTLLENHQGNHIRFLKPADGSGETVRVEALVEDHQLGSLTSKLSQETLAAPDSIETLKTDNTTPNTGMGAIGTYEGKGLAQNEFLERITQRLNADALRYSGSADPIRKVAVCGGAGVFLARKAIEADADAFITGDIKYHNYFTETEDFMLIDVGHYESEIPIASELQKQISHTFKDVEVSTTGVNTNPMKIFSPNKKS